MIGVAGGCDSVRTLPGAAELLAPALLIFHWIAADLFLCVEGGLPRCPAAVLALQAILQLAVVAANILNQTAPVTDPCSPTAAGLCLAMTRGQARAEQRGKGKWHINHVPWLYEAQALVAAQIDNERENAMKTAHEDSRSGEGKETSSRQRLSRRDILAGSGE